MLDSVESANEVTRIVKQTSTTRIRFRNLWSEILGKKGFRMFSLKLTDGARSVALAQLLIADRSAPKNMICAKIGTIGDRIRFGRISCVSPPSLSALSTIFGSMRLAE